MLDPRSFASIEHRASEYRREEASMLTANAVDVYDLLKPRIGEQESKSLLHFIEEQSVHLVREEISKGVATKEDITEVREELHREIAEVKKDAIRLEKEFLAFKSQMQFYLYGIAGLIIFTNPKILDLLGQPLGILPK
ncbi:MAG: hypothetical protein AB1797_02090 [bacterium]